MAKDKLVTLGDSLEEVMDRIEALKAELKPLLEQEEVIREDMTKGLLKKGLRYVKTSSGLAFGLVSGKTSFKVKQGKEKEALDWAMVQFPGILSITASKLNAVVKPMLTPPEFIERFDAPPHLAVRAQETD